MLVMDAQQVETTLKAILDAGGLRQLTDEEALHIVDRFSSFNKDTRLFLGHGYCLGLSPEHFKLMKPEEFREFIINFMSAVTNNSMIIQNVVLRKADDLLQQLKEKIRTETVATIYILRQVFSFRCIGHFIELNFPEPIRPKAKMAELVGLSAEDLINRQIGSVWTEMQTCISRYDEKAHPYGSDPEYRARIGRHVIKGFDNEESLKDAIRKDIEANKNEIYATIDIVDSYCPKEMMFISDTQTFLTNDQLFKWFANTMKKLDTNECM